MHNLESLKKDLIKAGFNKNDKVMIHSSLKSVGLVDGGANTLIRAFKDIISDGLIIFPTHTWSTINQDNMIFDCKNSKSCVGALTNIALENGFIRSMHPTHSVCAYGKDAKWYVDHDLNVNTPVNPKGCFGMLKDIDAKILFLGAPLSKNTFIHSIEEEFNVEDRFTEHIYNFKSKKDDVIIDYYMPRHYSTLSEHISEHYEKLLPLMLNKNIAQKAMIGDSVSYIVDAKGCYLLVSEILRKDIHAFDDFRNIEL